MTKPTLKSNHLEKHLSYSSHLNMNSLMSWLSRLFHFLNTPQQWYSTWQYLDTCTKNYIHITFQFSWSDWLTSVLTLSWKEVKNQLQKQLKDHKTHSTVTKLELNYGTIQTEPQDTGLFLSVLEVDNKCNVHDYHELKKISRAVILLLMLYLTSENNLHNILKKELIRHVAGILWNHVLWFKKPLPPSQKTHTKKKTP